MNQYCSWEVRPKRSFPPFGSSAHIPETSRYISTASRTKTVSKTSAVALAHGQSQSKTFQKALWGGGCGIAREVAASDGRILCRGGESTALLIQLPAHGNTPCRRMDDGLSTAVPATHVGQPGWSFSFLVSGHNCSSEPVAH